MPKMINVDGVCVPIKEDEDSVCPVCNGKGWFFIGDTVLECDCSRHTKSEDRCRYCGSTDGYWSSIYDWHCRNCGKVTVD